MMARDEVPINQIQVLWSVALPEIYRNLQVSPPNLEKLRLVLAAVHYTRVRRIRQDL